MVMNLLWQVDEDSGTSQNTASTNEPGPGYGALGLTLPGGYLDRGSILCWAFGEARWWELAEPLALKVTGGEEMKPVLLEVVFHHQPQNDNSWVVFYSSCVCIK